jgi:4-amino-4-deoxy-L-arabinose transferase-like glycosyltransferase
MTKKWEALFLLIILAIAAFFRLWKLNEIPPGLYPDVAINGNEALESLKTGSFKLFYPENNGREGLMMWLIALSFSIFGVSIWSIKIVAAIIGILTVLGLYLFTKELFNNSTLQHYNNPTIIALLASFFLATSFWHTNFSRIGFRAILLPFILVFSFYFLLRGFRTRKILNFILSGIFFGLGFYTYISFRFAILILPVIFLPYWLIYKKEGSPRKFLLFTFYFLLFTFLIALPIGLYFLKHPQDFVGRAAPISVFSAKNPIKEFLKSLILHLAMFNFYGDPNWRHNFSGSPMLPWPIGILFLIGVILSFGEIFKKSNYRNRNYQLLFTFYFLLFTFFTMLLPGILTYEGIPHSLRVIGVIPVVYIFVAIGSLKTYQFFDKNTKNKKLLLVACYFFLVAIAFSEFDKYFFDWGKNKEVVGAFTERFLKEGEILASLPNDVQKYVIVNESGVSVPYPDGIPMPAQTIMFVENSKYGEIKSNYLLPKDLDRIKIDKKGVILLMRYDEELFNRLKAIFPTGEIQEKDGIQIYEVK